MNEEKSVGQVIKTKRIGKGQVFFVAGCLIVLLVCFAWWIFGRKSHGIITHDGKPASLASSPEESRTVYDGKYFTFTYPESYTRRLENEAVKYPLLERVFLMNDSLQGQKIALTVQETDSSTLSEYASYRIRKDQSVVYTEEIVEHMGRKVVLLKKKNNSPEIALFFQEKNHVVSIVFSSILASEEVEREARVFLESFRLKNK